MRAATTTHRLALLAAVTALAALAGPAVAARPDAPTPGTYALKDGKTLSVAQNGGMRMFTVDGSRLDMKDGVVMETRDGKFITMKEDLNWKRLRLYGSLNPKLH